MLADYAVSNANTSTPTVSSATDPFQAGDAGNYWFNKSGVNGIPGWYPITSVSGGIATLNAAIGAVVLTNYTLNTAVGCGTSASLTSQTGSIDFSQKTTSISLTGFTTAAANAIILTATARKAYVGNGIQTTAGTNVTLGFFAISSVVTGVSITVDRNVTTAAGVGGAGGIGGALASVGQAGAIENVSGLSKIWIKTGSYTITSATTNIAAGCYSAPAAGGNTAWGGLYGYGTLRGDLGTAPTLTLNAAVSSATMVTLTGSSEMVNVNLNGGSNTTSKGVNSASSARVIKCKLSNFTNSGCSLGTGQTSWMHNCEVTGCSTIVASSAGMMTDCYIHDNTISGASPISAINCIFANNTGANDGISNLVNVLAFVSNCTFYTNGRNGVQFNSAATVIFINNLFISNVTNGINPSTASDNRVYYYNNAFFGNGTPIANTPIFVYGSVTLTSDPFTNAAGGDFSLTPAAIALIGSQGIPGTFPGLASTTGYLAIGAVQPLAQGIFVESNTAIILNPLSVVGY